MFGHNLMSAVYGGSRGGCGEIIGDMMEDTFQGSSIAALRRKALEHSVTMSGMVAYR